jgi:hypothetical protein
VKIACRAISRGKVRDKSEVPPLWPSPPMAFKKEARREDVRSQGHAIKFLPQVTLLGSQMALESLCSALLLTSRVEFGRQTLSYSNVLREDHLYVVKVILITHRI